MNRLTRPLRASAEGLPPGWAALVASFFDEPLGRQLCAQVDAAVAAGVEVYPTDPLRALRDLAPEDVRVVILGQDPYHGPDEAEGLAFSVLPGVKIPPSLRNIRQELAADIGVPLPASGSLLAWSRGGVLLLNTALTVERDRPASHAKLGWQVLTDRLIERVARTSTGCVFLLWGAHAQAKRALIEAAGGGRHGVQMSNHPSPLAARRPPMPFLGSRPFSAANRLLVSQGMAPVDWRLVPDGLQHDVP